MTTENYLEKNKTSTLKKGDNVVMYNCGEADFQKYKDKVWVCKTNSYIDYAGQEVVFLDGFTGCFLVKFLKTKL